ncbi:ABC transporter permease [Rubrobacter calidifluminis]|uniref:ABC transporter permease n=1 Tax=Rubrobacter calidifluminis TaxID=1392640 RepID=UPI0023600EFE|nr:proline/glycine betaine ABC transporter permease [Rubrobacter calidifluminis]
MIALLQQGVHNYVPRIPIGGWVSDFVNYITDNFSGFFDGLSTILGGLVGAFDFVLNILPPWAMVLIFMAIALWLGGWRVMLLTLIGFGLILGMNLWDDAMTTLALVIASTAVALLIGIPVGILSAQYRTVETIVRPILDFMQTLPAFVYLVPAIILLGLGNAPGLLSVVIFAMPPAVRLTLLGLQQVPKETIEAAKAFGSTRWQTLVKVELPQAFTTIMAGVNQVIMLALSMVVIAALIGAGGLGTVVYKGLSTLDVGTSFEGGLGIVIIAIILDRITRNIGRGRQKPGGKGGLA